MESGRCILNQCIAWSRLAIEEPSRNCCPDKSNHTFSNHGTIEYRTTHLLIAHAARHQRTLCAVKTRDGTTGNRNEESREDIVLPCLRLRSSAHIIEVSPNLRNRRPMQEQPHHQRACHKQQREGEQRINLTDNLVDRQHRSDDIVTEDDKHPHHRLAAQLMQNHSRRIHEHRTHHDEQQHGEYQHHALRGLAQILTNHLWQSCTVMAHRKHAREIVVHGAGEDTAEHNPQISHRTELRTHNGTEDRTCTGNVQELNHEDFPRRENNVIETIGLSNSWCHTIIWTKHTLYETSIEQIAHNKSYKTQQK